MRSPGGVPRIRLGIGRILEGLGQVLQDPREREDVPELAFTLAVLCRKSGKQLQSRPREARGQGHGTVRGYKRGPMKVRVLRGYGWPLSRSCNQFQGRRLIDMNRVVAPRFMREVK